MSEASGQDGPKRLALQAWLAATILILASPAAIAADREHGPHVHGVGRLNVAAEGARVEIELTSPGVDIVGFEHPADSAAEKAAVAEAASSLKDGAMLFVFPDDAGCRLEAADVDAPLAEAHDDHRKEHGREAGASERESEKHSEFHARYRFRCARPDRLLHLDVKLFERFPGMRELEVQAISPLGQGAQELNPRSTRLKF